MLQPVLLIIGLKLFILKACYVWGLIALNYFEGCFLTISCWSTLTRQCPVITQAEKQICGFLSSSSGSCRSWTSLLSFLNICGGKLWQKQDWIFANAVAKPTFFFVTVPCLLKHIQMCSAWVEITAVWKGCWMLSLQYHEANLICILTLQFQRTTWHLPACKVGENVLYYNS